jgi:hypothetical protein
MKEITIKVAVKDSNAELALKSLVDLAELYGPVQSHVQEHELRPPFVGTHARRDDRPRRTFDQSWRRRR